MLECTPIRCGKLSDASRVGRTAGGYTVRALRAVRAACADSDAHAPGSREDFFSALEVLSSKSKSRRGSNPMAPRRSSASSAERQFRPILVSVPWTTWVAVFGEPHEVTQHQNRVAQVPVAVWQQKCAGGSITCIGHLFQRAPGECWVTLTRVG